MAPARTVALQTGYLLSGLIDGATLVFSGYGALGVVLAAALALCAALVLRIAELPERKLPAQNGNEEPDDGHMRREGTSPAGHGIGPVTKA